MRLAFSYRADGRVKNGGAIMLVNLNEVLLDARKNKYGVGLFNTTDTNMLQAAIEAAEEELEVQEALIAELDELIGIKEI